MSNGSVIGNIARQIAAPRDADRRRQLASMEELSGVISLDCRLRLFAGMICRVKHAFLWETAPQTMARISRSGLSLQLFGIYALDLPFKDLAALTPGQRTVRFLTRVSNGADSFRAWVDLIGVAGIAADELRLYQKRICTLELSRPDEGSAQGRSMYGQCNGYKSKL